jgi:hypothetical protein
MKSIPIPIKFLLIIVLSTFIIEEIVFLYIFEWNIYEVYVDDPIYIFVTLLWFAIVIWISTDIVRRKKHISNTIKILFIITLLFYGFDITEYDYTFFEIMLLSFSPLLWLTAWIVSKNNICSEWFVN